MQPIRVYDKNLNMLTETDNYLSLQFMPRFYEVGDFELHINQYIESAEYFVKGNLIVLDKRGDKAMLIRHREVALDQNGKASENWRITGVTLEGVLDQRATIPPENTSHDRKSGNAETVMKHYVENHFINPVDSDRKIEFIEIAADQERGAHVEWESRFKNVSDELTAISKQANLGWIMYADMERRKWIFDVVEPRNVTQRNEAGLQPVFFSPDFSTIKTQQFVDSDLNYKNVGYVGGQGEGVERKIVKIGEAKGIDLHEIFIDARDVSETDEETEEELPPEEYEQLLIERGQRRMREFETTFYLEAQILTPSINRNNDFAMSTPFEYETDFRLGDVVQVFNKKWNITMNAPITEFKEIHEPGGFILEAVFGEAQPTLINKIKREFDDLKGIEQQELPARLAVERMREAMEYGDERLSEEERARIEQALEILDESKEYAGEEAYQAEQEAKRHADDQDIVYDEEAKRDASQKSEQAESNAKKHAEDQDEFVREDAGQDATDKANRAEDNAKGHADDRADEAERNAKDYTDENAVDWEAYNAKMQEIGDDLADKVGVEYVDGQLQLKADSDVVQAIDATVNDLSDTADNLQQAVADNADELDAHDGRITNVVTDLDTVEGNLNVAITDLSNLDDTVSQAQTDISANATAISLKANQDDLDTVSGDVSSLSAELSVVAGEVEAKAERSVVETLEGDVTTVSDDLSALSVNVEEIEGNVSSLTQTVSDHGTEISDLETARLQHADLIEDRVTKTEYSTDMDNVITDLTDHETRITQTESDITSKVEQTDFNSVTGDLSNRVSTVEQTADGLVIDVSDVSAELDNLEIGGRNLIEDSSKYELTPRDTSYNYASMHLTKTLESDTVYTVSADVEVTDGDVTEITVLQRRGSNDSNGSVGDLEIRDGKIMRTFTTSNDETNRLLFYAGKSGNTNGNGVLFTNVQLEKGNKSTDWTPAPEDTQAEITDVYEYASSEFEQVAGRIDLKADSTYVDTINDIVEDHSAQFTVMSEEISGKVDDGDVRSIFTQEAGSFTFDADQINFLGHTFGKDATFSGKVSSGEITTDSVVIGVEDASYYDDQESLGQGLTLKNPVFNNATGSYEFGNLFRIAVSENEANFFAPQNLFNFFSGANPWEHAALRASAFFTEEGRADVIVDEGSNADGEYIRYSSGLQICWANHIELMTDESSGSLSRTSNPVTWSFPASFQSGFPISVSVSVASVGRWGDIANEPNSTGVNLIAFSSYNPSTSTWTTTATAIGRWK
ncbi:hypothetical protein ACDX78_02125 [Virgibacillus oceani]